MERPVRKNIRLDNYDYSRNGAYFLTVCTKNKICIFWDSNDKYKPITADNKKHFVGAHSVRPPIERKIHLSDYGKAVKRSFQIVLDHYPMIFIDKYVIMPNHIHMIIRIEQIETGIVNGGRTECAPTISQVIKNFKENVTREIGFPVWQKSFYDRVIRNNDEYAAYWRYIHHNPVDWENDELFSKEYL